MTHKLSYENGLKTIEIALRGDGAPRTLDCDCRAASYFAWGKLLHALRKLFQFRLDFFKVAPECGDLGFQTGRCQP